MNSVFVVVKCRPVETKYGTMDFRTNENVCTTEELANEYIASRLKAKDRDDRGCRFLVEPWLVSSQL